MLYVEMATDGQSMETRATVIEEVSQISERGDICIPQGISNDKMIIRVITIVKLYYLSLYLS